MIADRGAEASSKYWHIIQEHDRLRRVKNAQKKLLKDMEEYKDK